MFRNCIPFCIPVLILVLIGCSGSSSNPAAPPADEQGLTQGAVTGQGLSGPSAVVWGFWDITIDPATWETEIVPIRAANLTVDVVKFLQPPAGLVNGVWVSVTDNSEFITEGKLVLDVTLGHPFPGYDQFTGFDVLGVFIHTGGKFYDYDLVDDIEFPDGVTSAVLENADGYTMWMSPELFPEDGTIFTYMPGILGTDDFPGIDAADVNGYKYFADSLASDENVGGFFNDQFNCDMRGKFAPGAANTREYQLRFPMDGGMPVLNFQYAVIANWDVHDKTLYGDPDILDVPEDFPPTANAREPFYLNVTDNSTTWYVDDDHRGGDIVLDIDVFTWHGVEGIGDIYLTGNSPDLVPGGFAWFDPTGLVWTPFTNNGYRATLTIEDSVPASVVGQELLIAIEAEPEVTYDKGFGTEAPDSPLTSFFLHDLDVAAFPPQSDITAMASAGIEPYFDGFGPLGTTDDPIPTEWWLTLDASASTGTIDQYLWEMNGDDLFDDAEGMVISAGFPDPGTHVIKLKVTDGFGGEDIYELPGSYEVVEGTYVWWAYPGDYNTGARESPWITIPEALAETAEDAYILVRGDDDDGGQCEYTDDLTLTDANTGVRIQGYYGDYDTDVPPHQTGFVRVETDNVIFDGFEVSGPSYSTYMPYGHTSKLGNDQADNVLFRHLYIHDLNANCKAILAWFGGSLTVQNVLEIELNGMYQKNQAHEDDTDPGPQIDFINCTLDRLETSDGDNVGLYVSSGGGSDFFPTIRNCIFTDIAGGGSIYFRRQGPFNAYSEFTCTYDTGEPPDGGIYYQGIEIGDECIEEDPMYVDPYGDHHLQEGSPCIDTGDPAILDYDDSASDMGCYGGPYGDWNFED